MIVNDDGAGFDVLKCWADILSTKLLYSAFFNIYRSGVLTALFGRYMADVL